MYSYSPRAVYTTKKSADRCSRLKYILLAAVGFRYRLSEGSTVNDALSFGFEVTATMKECTACLPYVANGQRGALDYEGSPRQHELCITVRVDPTPVPTFYPPPPSFPRRQVY